MSYEKCQSFKFSNRLRAGELAGNVECNEILADNDVRNTITVISNLHIKNYKSKLVKYLGIFIY